METLKGYRYSATVAYDGQFFSGWQIQPGETTVQQSLTDALSLLNGETVQVAGAGRTDGGVHAKGQVASFLMNRQWREDKLRLAVNAHLPEGMTVSQVRSRPFDFDARRDAQWRQYRYFVWNAPWCPPYLRPYVWWRKGRPWDMELFDKGCRLLEGRHDFSAFCRLSEVPENPWRRLYWLRWRRRGPMTVLALCGDAFLTNMVRIILGNLDEVARGHQSLSWFQSLLEGASRTDSAMTAPASGLFFWRIGYRAKYKVQS